MVIILRPPIKPALVGEWENWGEYEFVQLPTAPETVILPTSEGLYDFEFMRFNHWPRSSASEASVKPRIDVLLRMLGPHELKGL